MEALHGGVIAHPAIFPVSLTKMVSVSIDQVIFIHIIARFHRKLISFSFQIIDINVFIAGGSDGRHLLELLGKDNGDKNISAFLIEQNLMLYARQMLFLSIILDDSSSITSQEKSRILLEVLGNVKIRPSTAKYLRLNVSKLIDICGNEASREEDQPNQLRYLQK